MKKVLQSFLSRVTSRISFVMLASRPATGGTRRKSRILQDGDKYSGSFDFIGSPPKKYESDECTRPNKRYINRGYLDLDRSSTVLAVAVIATRHRSLF